MCPRHAWPRAAVEWSPAPVASSTASCTTFDASVGGGVEPAERNARQDAGSPLRREARFGDRDDRAVGRVVVRVELLDDQEALEPDSPVRRRTSSAPEVLDVAVREHADDQV